MIDGKYFIAMNLCVYKITLPDGKGYIGISSKVSERRVSHFSKAFKTTKYDHFPLYPAMRKFRSSEIRFEILVSNVSSLERLSIAEMLAIYIHETEYYGGKGYNQSLGGMTPNQIARRKLELNL